MDQERNPATAEPHYDALLQACLSRVFNERDDVRRAEAIAALFSDAPTMLEPYAVVAGRAAISCVAGDLLSQFGEGFALHPRGKGIGHHGLGMLRWQGEDSGRVLLRGTHVAAFVDGRIERLWILLEEAGPAADLPGPGDPSVADQLGSV